MKDNVFIKMPSKLANSIKIFQIPISPAFFGNGLRIKFNIFVLSTYISKAIKKKDAVNNNGKAIPKNVKKLKLINSSI